MTVQKNKQKQSKIKLPDDDFSHSLASYNKNQKYLKVNVSDLKLRLQDFKKSTQNTSFIIPTASLLALWVPIFTSDFKGFLGANPEAVRAGYIVFAVILTAITLRKLLNILIFQMIRLGFINPEEWDPLIDKDYLIRHENDPVRLVEMMCDEDEQQS